MKISEKTYDALDEYKAITVEGEALKAGARNTVQWRNLVEEHVKKACGLRLDLLDAIKSDINNNQVVVEIRGGVCENVTGVSNYTIVDYDNIESGCCPICSGNLLDGRCCGIDWGNPPEDLYQYLWDMNRAR